MSKHTPEPWYTEDEYIIIKRGEDDNPMIGYLDGDFDWDTDYANAARIVACVNALAGIPDPAKWVEQAKKFEARIDELEERQRMLNVPQVDISIK